MVDPRRHAIVVGGSIAGLLAARVLSDHFERVTILDRDRLPLEEAPRRGVPQARHAHGLLGRGREILCGLFPDLDTELAVAGISLLHAGREVGWLYPCGWQKPFSDAVWLCAPPRDLLESLLRRRVRAIPQVEFVEETDVRGLIATPDGRRVQGVKISNAAGAERSLLDADLVVDASGRGSRAPRWLEEIGAGPTPETIVDAHVGYASRLYAGVASFPHGWQALFLRGTRRVAGIFPQGNGHHLITLMGYAGDHPSGEESEFLRFAASVNDCGVIADALRGATAVSPIHKSHSTVSRRRHFERTKRRPQGFLCLGDAACALNPVYAQGITVAALCVQSLASLLENRTVVQVCEVFPSRLNEVISFPWQLAALEDFRHPTTRGQRPWFSGLTQRYTEKVFALATQEAEIAARLVKVMQMASPPRSLVTPGLLWQVLNFSTRPKS